MIITLVFEKNANFFAKNCQKSQKIVIITSVLGIAESCQGRVGSNTETVGHILKMSRQGVKES
jgi:hypothetical protein